MYGGGQLGQQAKLKVTIKLVFTCSNSSSKKQKIPAHQYSISLQPRNVTTQGEVPMNEAQIGDSFTEWGPHAKISFLLIDPGWEEGEEEGLGGKRC